MKHYPSTSMGQALLDALERKQALAKIQRGPASVAKAQRPTSITPVRDHRGQINEVASLIKAAHSRRATQRG
jgi:hypothetical protein